MGCGAVNDVAINQFAKTVDGGQVNLLDAGRHRAGDADFHVIGRQQSGGGPAVAAAQQHHPQLSCMRRLDRTQDIG